MVMGTGGGGSAAAAVNIVSVFVGMVEGADMLARAAASAASGSGSGTGAGAVKVKVMRRPGSGTADSAGVVIWVIGCMTVAVASLIAALPERVKALMVQENIPAVDAVERFWIRIPPSWALLAGTNADTGLFSRAASDRGGRGSSGTGAASASASAIQPVAITARVAMFFLLFAFSFLVLLFLLLRFGVPIVYIVIAIFVMGGLSSFRFVLSDPLVRWCARQERRASPHAELTVAAAGASPVADIAPATAPSGSHTGAFGGPPSFLGRAVGACLRRTGTLLQRSSGWGLRGRRVQYAGTSVYTGSAAFTQYRREAPYDTGAAAANLPSDMASADVTADNASTASNPRILLCDDIVFLEVLISHTRVPEAHAVFNPVASPDAPATVSAVDHAEITADAPNASRPLPNQPTEDSEDVSLEEVTIGLGDAKPRSAARGGAVLPSPYAATAVTQRKRWWEHISFPLCGGRHVVLAFFPREPLSPASAASGAPPVGSSPVAAQSSEVPSPSRFYVTSGEFVSALLAWFVVFLWLGQRNVDPLGWILQNILGVCLCCATLIQMRLSTLRSAAILSSLFWAYDIFMVFLSPYVFGGDSVMISVATAGAPQTEGISNLACYCREHPEDTRACGPGEYMPILFRIPRLNDWRGGYAMLGLGDIILPGLMVALALRKDLEKPSVAHHEAMFAGGGNNSGENMVAGEANPNTSSSTSNGSHPPVGRWRDLGYWVIAMSGYCFGLAAANLAVVYSGSGQPALLYLCPAVLGPVMVVAHYRGDLRSWWNGPVALSNEENTQAGDSLLESDMQLPPAMGGSNVVVVTAGVPTAVDAAPNEMPSAGAINGAPTAVAQNVQRNQQEFRDVDL
jgi:hypothetical protein